MAANNFSARTVATKARGGAGPIGHGLMGIVFLLLWLAVSLFQIQTSETYLMGGRVGGTFNWGMLTQFPDMLQGKFTGAYLMACMFAWVVQLVTIAVGLGFEHEAVLSNSARHKTIAAGIWLVGSLFIVGYNMLSDNNYALLPIGWWRNLIVTGVLSFAAVYFFPVALKCFDKATVAFS